MNDYSITILTFIAIQAIVACGLNVIVGYAGQISLGHAAFFGIGAYASALLTTKAGLHLLDGPAAGDPSHGCHRAGARHAEPPAPGGTSWR